MEENQRAEGREGETCFGAVDEGSSGPSEWKTETGEVEQRAPFHHDVITQVSGGDISGVVVVFAEVGTERTVEDFEEMRFAALSFKVAMRRLNREGGDDIRSI